jgi:hypothetical protein
MSPENYATRPLRPLFDTHGDAGVYLIQMQTDAQPIIGHACIERQLRKLLENPLELIGCDADAAVFRRCSYTCKCIGTSDAYIGAPMLY